MTTSAQHYELAVKHVEGSACRDSIRDSKWFLASYEHTHMLSTDVHQVQRFHTFLRSLFDRLAKTCAVGDFFPIVFHVCDACMHVGNKYVQVMRERGRVVPSLKSTAGVSRIVHFYMGLNMRRAFEALARARKKKRSWADMCEMDEGTHTGAQE